MTIREWVAIARGRLREEGIESPELESQMLAAHAIGKERSWVLAHGEDPLEDHEVRAEAALERRLKHEPLAYILGWREFYGRRFEVDSSVLIPRQETETLIELALDLSRLNHVRTVLDVGAGSGCIAVTLKLESPELEVTAIDVSPKALQTARQNDVRLDAKIEWLQSDLYSMLGERRFDLIVSNPPYVGREDPLPKEVSEFEPQEALYAPTHWDSCFKELANQSAAHLTGPKIMIVEVGDGQSDAVTEIFQAERWTLLEARKDLSGMPRALAFRLP